jgi:hypothetical protein
MAGYFIHHEDAHNPFKTCPWVSYQRQKGTVCVPVPDDLLKRLNKYKIDNPEKSFVIGKAKNRPEIHLLRLLKKLVKDAGLN